MTSRWLSKELISASHIFMSSYFLANEVMTNNKKQAILLSMCGPVTEKLVRVKLVPPDQFWMQKLVRPDQIKSTKTGLAGPLLVTKIGLT